MHRKARCLDTVVPPVFLGVVVIRTAGVTVQEAFQNACKRSLGDAGSSVVATSCFTFHCFFILFCLFFHLNSWGVWLDRYITVSHPARLNLSFFAEFMPYFWYISTPATSWKYFKNEKMEHFVPVAMLPSSQGRHECIMTSLVHESVSVVMRL